MSEGRKEGRKGCRTNMIARKERKERPDAKDGWNEGRQTMIGRKEGRKGNHAWKRNMKGSKESKKETSRKEGRKEGRKEHRFFRG